MTSATVALWGASGRMGRAFEAACAERDDVTIIARPARSERPGDDLAVSVVVDFSAPEGAAASLAWARARGIAWVSGTTGIDASFAGQLDDAARQIPVLWASNMSLGVAVLHHLVAEAARALPASFDAELVELHHRRKKDAPSGTALTLARALADARAGEPARLDTSRSGLVGEREQGTVGVFGVRGGDVVGEHTVYFLGDGERVELTHRATDRMIFARGAATAAVWMQGQPAGRYAIADVLGLG